MKKPDNKTILLIAAGVFIAVVILFAIISASMGHHAPAAAAAGTAAIAVEVARRQLAEASAKAAEGEAEALQKKKDLQKIKDDFEQQSGRNNVDINGMTLEQKVALANKKKEGEK